MTGKELIEWIVSEKLEEAEVLVCGKEGYEEIRHIWEGESGEHGAIMLETKKRKMK